RLLRCCALLDWGRQGAASSAAGRWGAAEPGAARGAALRRLFRRVPAGHRGAGRAWTDRAGARAGRMARLARVETRSDAAARTGGGDDLIYGRGEYEVALLHAAD